MASGGGKNIVLGKGNSDDPFQDAYKKGNDAWTADNYGLAEELYSRALEANPRHVDALVSRSHARAKLEKYESALKDADLAIQIGRSSDAWTDASVTKAFIRGGVAAFNMAQFGRAKNYFIEGQKLDSSVQTGLGQWIYWCDEKIAKHGKGDSSDVKPPKKDDAPAPLSGNKTPAATATVVPMPVPKIKHDWYQTETTVVIEVRIKGLKKEDVAVEFNPRELSVTAKLPAGGGSDYSLEIDLAHEIVPEKSQFKVMSTKIEVKMLKRDGIRWNVLEGEDLLPAQPLASGSASAASTSTTKPPSYPGFGKKDWSKIDKDIEKELESEKPEGEAALNELFAKIYKDADDDTKRAMNKSFQESGGTVLSTNWSDIKKEKTKIQPPDGMEYKKWD